MSDVAERVKKIVIEHLGVEAEKVICFVNGEKWLAFHGGELCCDASYQFGGRPVIRAFFGRHTS